MILARWLEEGGGLSNEIKSKLLLSENNERPLRLGDKHIGSNADVYHVASQLLLSYTLARHWADI